MPRTIFVSLSLILYLLQPQVYALPLPRHTAGDPTPFGCLLSAANLAWNELASCDGGGITRTIPHSLPSAQGYDSHSVQGPQSSSASQQSGLTRPSKDVTRLEEDHHGPVQAEAGPSRRQSSMPPAQLGTSLSATARGDSSTGQAKDGVAGVGKELEDIEAQKQLDSLMGQVNKADPSSRRKPGTLSQKEDPPSAGGPSRRSGSRSGRR